MHSNVKPLLYISFLILYGNLQVLLFCEQISLIRDILIQIICKSFFVSSRFFIRQFFSGLWYMLNLPSRVIFFLLLRHYISGWYTRCNLGKLYLGISMCRWHLNQERRRVPYHFASCTYIKLTANATTTCMYMCKIWVIWQTTLRK